MALELINLGSAPDAGDGDQARTAFGKANDNFAEVKYFTNVMEHGAVGDGSTDDSVAIQAAIDAVNTAGGGVVYVPEGIYVCQSIELTSNVRLVGSGAGSILRHKSAATAYMVQITSGSTDAGLENLVIDGNSPNITDPVLPVHIFGSRCYVKGVRIYDAKLNAILMAAGSLDTLIDGVHVYKVNASTSSGPNEGAIVGENSDTPTGRAIIRNCVVSDPGQHCIGGRFDGVIFQGNTCINTGSGGDGISGYPGVTGNTNRRRVVIGNLIIGAVNNGIHIGGDGDNVVVGNAVFASGNRGISIEANTEASAVATVVGNTVDATTSLQGIWISNLSKGSVSGNTVNGATTNGIEVSACDAITVTGNTATNCTANGIAIIGSTRVSVTGNTVTDNSSRGIRVSSTSDGVLITGNYVAGNTTAQIYTQDNATTNVFIHGNVVKGTSPFNLTGTGTKYVGRNEGDEAVSVVAAATLTLPLGRQVVTVTGNTGITSITATHQTGNTVTLIFTGTPTVTDGSNLKLAGNFVAAGTTNDADTLTLVCDGTSWFEVARSVN